MLSTLLVVTLVLWVGSNLQTWRDNATYGSPRTAQYDVNVGHGGISHFTVQNLQGVITITEIPGSGIAHSRMYQGPRLYGNGGAELPATLSFQDVNHDGRLDLLLHIEAQTIVFLNTASGTFATPTA